MMGRRPGRFPAIVMCFAALTAAGCGGRSGDDLIGTWGQTIGDTDTDGGTSITLHFLPNGTMTEDVVSIKQTVHMDFKYKARDGRLDQTIVGGTMNGRPAKFKEHEGTFHYALQDDHLLIADPDHNKTMDLKRLSEQ